ncbi:MAG: hypothetical protein E7249_20900 [Paenibacillaceae bacterium]|nr:hypothetical protein [Paenibacillaceae bacterium]
MKKNTLLFFLFTLACLIILIGGIELIKYYTQLNRQYYTYIYPIMVMKLLFPCSLGLLLFFRQHIRMEVYSIHRVVVDGVATLVVVVYLLIISRRLITYIFAQAETLICFTLLLSSFLNSLLEWKRYKSSN